MKSIAQLFRNVSFWLIFLPFATYVGFFNATSSLINQIYYPYAFTEDQAGIGGALLIIVGIIASIITSIIIDRTHAYKWTIKILIPITAVAFLALVFTPPTRALPAPYTILALLGASSFSLLPVALEYVVELTFPVGPETSSVVLWTGGQFLGAIFTIIMASLKDEKGSTDVNGDRPPGNLQRSLVFQAVLCCVVAVLPMMLGWKKLGLAQEDKKRMVVDSHHRTPAMLG
jgi:FLVCR family MFS transporter 7